MVTFDIVLLSSSPPTSSGGRRYAATPPSNQQRVMTPAHPSLLLESNESTKKDTSGALKSGSRAAPIPHGAERGFATASSLVKSHHFNDEPEAEADIEPTEKVQPKRKARKLPRDDNDTDLIESAVKPKPKKTRRTKPSTGGEKAATNASSRPETATTSSHFTILDAPVSGTTTSTSKLRKPRVKKATKSITESTTAAADDPKPKRQRKSRVKVGINKDDTSGTAPPKAALTKLDDDGEREVPNSPARTKSTRRKRTSQALVDEALDLEEAVVRRQDWTPVKDTCTNVLGSDSVTKELEGLDPSVNTFTSMVSSFAFADAPVQLDAVARPVVLGDVETTKRRRVELIDIPITGPSSAGISPEKGKAPKRKARTITDIVTGQYTGPTENPHTGDIFHPQPIAMTTTIPLNDVTNRPKPKERAKQSKTRVSKPKKTTLKASAKPKKVAEKLLSPASAAARVNRQDLLFGTSSQLALEESPTTIREIQRAIKISEFDTSQIHSSDIVAARRMQSRLRKAQGGRGLWAASARDGEGDLLEKEDIWLPEPDRTQDIPLLMDSTCDPSTNSVLDIDDFELPVPTRIVMESNSPHSSPRVSLHGSPKVQRPLATEMSFDDIDDYELPPPSNQNANSSFLDIDDFAAPAPSLLAPSRVPNPPLSSTASPLPLNPVDFLPLSKPVSSSKSVAADYNKQPETRFSIPKPPRTPRSQSSQRRYIEIDEIVDSEDDEALSPTPPEEI